jgi:hypothetical protein
LNPLSVTALPFQTANCKWQIAPSSFPDLFVQHCGYYLLVSNLKTMVTASSHSRNALHSNASNPEPITFMQRGSIFLIQHSSLAVVNWWASDLLSHHWPMSESAYKS